MDRPASANTLALFKQLLLPVQRFFRTEAAAGIVLALATAAALVWVNLVDEASYRALVNVGVALEVARFGFHEPLIIVINDALMTVFFFVVGLEIKHELAHGHLKTPRKALLPLVAAVGGMLVPAGLYFVFNRSGPAAAGWAIPMATDIAFAAGVLTLFKNRVAASVPVFLIALAIFDDIGGVLVIAAFYGEGIHVLPLVAAAGAAVVGVIVLRQRPHGLVVFAIGVVLWLLFHDAGIHATLAGVVLGLMIPANAERPARDVLSQLHAHTGALIAKPGDESIDNAEVQSIEGVLSRMEPPVLRLMRLLHPFVAFGVVPLFAFVNAGVRVTGVPFDALFGPVFLGVFVGLVVGKLVGVFVATMLAVKVGISSLPDGMDRRTLLGVSALAGIGFTVALFIANLAFARAPALLAQAKVGILFGSIVATLAGALIVATRKAPVANGGSHR
jgi:NhaA family Na+:H+ antiporter